MSGLGHLSRKLLRNFCVSYHLSKYVPRLLDTPLVCQHGPDSVCRPYVFVVVPQHGFVHRQRPVLVLLLLLLVLGRLVQSLQPHVPQSDMTEVGEVKEML